MTNLTIYNKSNSQQILLTGLTDSPGANVSTATITAQLVRNGNVLTGGNLSFNSVSGEPGNYTADLEGFDATPGRAELVITGNNSSATLQYNVFVTIAERSL